MIYHDGQMDTEINCMVHFMYYFHTYGQQYDRMLLEASLERFSVIINVKLPTYS
jgi:hypothetical protein